MNLNHPVAAANNPLLWTEKHQLNWAHRAHERFVNSLSEEVRERWQQKDHKQEASVVVFGKTQVGKTTLIMDLMGISETAMNRVSNVLRGGRPAGKSATATVMEYKRSVDEFWHLKIGETESAQLNDSGMEKKLGELRKDMEEQRLKVDSPCIVAIPKDCFITQSDKKATVRMLDLPGDSPANDVEKNHVCAMAKDYVPMADLILLVGRGDDLSFLQPNNLHLPGIEDWQSVPNRFRIITTYSFTPQSVRDSILEFGNNIDEKFFQNRLIQEIEKFGELSKDAKNSELYFPLEFGTSWLKAKNSNDGRVVYEKVCPLIEKLKEKLHDDIQDSTTDMARLHSVVDVHITIAHVKKEKLDGMNNIIEKLKKELRQHMGEWEKLKNLIEEKQEECNVIKERLENITYKQLQWNVCNGIKIASINSGIPDKTVSGFKLCINTVKDSLKEKIRLAKPKYGDESKWFWRNVQINWKGEFLDDMLDKQFNEFASHLNDYWSNDYYPSISNDYNDDKGRLENCVQDAIKLITEIARKWWLDAALECRKKYDYKLTNMEFEIRNLKRLKDKIRDSIEKEDAEIEERKSKIEDFKKQMDNDLEESKRFKEILDDEYSNELKHRCAAIAKSTNSVESFASLLAAVQLEDIRKKLLYAIKKS